MIEACTSCDAYFILLTLVLRQRLKDVGKGFPYRPIWAALYSLQCMVEEGDVHMFDHAIQLTSVITDSATDLIAIKDFAKIVTGLKIMVRTKLINFFRNTCRKSLVSSF